jgi:uncharacterized protein with beta-barrel porin domain
MRHKSFKKYILCTIFLTGFHGAEAFAIDYVLNGPIPGPYEIFSGDSLTITSDGSVTISGSPANGILIDSQFATFFTNDGLVSSDDIAVLLTNGSMLSAGITNNGTITSNNADTIRVTNGANITNGITNSGSITGASSALLATDGGSITGSITNSGLMDSDGLNNFATIQIQNGGGLNGNIINSGTINNSGTHAIQLMNGTTSMANITNEAGGTISAAANGIYITNSATLNGNIINQGDIQTAQDGISIDNSAVVNGNITNDASGIITSTNGYGVHIDNGGSHYGSFTNDGSITGNLGGVLYANTNTTLTFFTNNDNASIVATNGKGVDLYTLINLTGDFYNGGTISGTTQAVHIRSSPLGGVLSNGGTMSGGINGLRVESTYISGGIINNGTMNGGIDGYIAINGGSTPTLENNNLITGNSVGVNLSSGGTITTLINNGTINGDVDDGLSIAGGGNLTTLQNNNRITGGTNGIYITTSSINGNIINAGTITGTSGAGITYFDAGWSGELQNSGTIRGATGIIFDTSTNNGISNNVGGLIEGTNGTAVSFSDLGGRQDLYLNGGRIIGDVIDNNAANNNSYVQVDQDFTAEGNFTVSQLIISSGQRMNTAGYGLDLLGLNNTGTLDIGANSIITTEAVQQSNGSYVFEVNGNNAGRLVVTSAPLDLTGSTISVRVGANPTTSPYLIIDSSSAITGGPGAVPTVVASNSYLWSFSIVDGTAFGGDNTDIYLEAIQANTMPTPGNTGAVGVVLANLLTTDPQLNSVISAMNNAPDAASLNAVLQSTLPIISYAPMTTANNVTLNAFELINTRLADLNGQGRFRSGTSTGDKTFNKNFWVQAFGQRGNQGARANSAGTFDGYDANTYGTSFGVDSDRIFVRSTVGAAVTYAHTDISGLLNTDMNIDSYQLSMYGQHNLKNDVFLRGITAYTLNDVTSKRSNIGGIPGLNAYGDYNASQVSAKLTAGREYVLDQSLIGSPRITPTVFTNYLRYMPNSYTETGAGGASLSVEGKNLNLLEFGVNVQSKWDWQLANGGVLHPTLQAGYHYDVVGDNIQTISSFTGGGAAFGTQGIRPAQSTVNGGFGMTYQQDDAFSFTVSYNYEHKADYNSHAALVRLKYNF